MSILAIGSFACFQAYGGLRLKNVVHPKRNEVNLNDGWLNIKSQSKTGKPVSIPITPDPKGEMVMGNLLHQELDCCAFGLNQT